MGIRHTSAQAAVLTRLPRLNEEDCMMPADRVFSEVTGQGTEMLCRDWAGDPYRPLCICCNQ